MCSFFQGGVKSARLTKYRKLLNLTSNQNIQLFFSIIYFSYLEKKNKKKTFEIFFSYLYF